MIWGSLLKEKLWEVLVRHCSQKQLCHAVDSVFIGEYKCVVAFKVLVAVMILEDLEIDDFHSSDVSLCNSRICFTFCGIIFDALFLNNFCKIASNFPFIRPCFFSRSFFKLTNLEGIVFLLVIRNYLSQTITANLSNS